MNNKNLTKAQDFQNMWNQTLWHSLFLPVFTTLFLICNSKERSLPWTASNLIILLSFKKSDSIYYNCHLFLPQLLPLFHPEFFKSGPNKSKKQPHFQCFTDSNSTWPFKLGKKRIDRQTESNLINNKLAFCSRHCHKIIFGKIGSKLHNL